MIFNDQELHIAIKNGESVVTIAFQLLSSNLSKFRIGRSHLLLYYSL